MFRSQIRIIAGALAVALLAGASSVATAGPKGPTIVDVAIEANSSGPYAGEFDTLIAALTSPAGAELLAKLSGNGQFTVFAPTDGAFANIGLNPGNVAGTPDLDKVLMYHVTRGRRASGDVTSSSQIRTLLGESLSVDGDMLNGASKIIVVDVEAANGIIHVVNEVLLP